MVVLAITSILTALLFPGMRAARDSAHRLMCASNMRQLGSAMILYAHDHRERLPDSELARRGQMLDRMALTVDDANTPGRIHLDGLGLLFQFSKYCDSPKCLYCPSHQNTHQYEEYETDIERSTKHSYSYGGTSYSNYQYVGNDGSPDRLHLLRDDRILISDGFRTKADYNHQVGMNTIRGDCSIHWWNDDQNQFYLGLPDTPLGTSAQTQIFEEVWSLVSETTQGQDSGGS